MQDSPAETAEIYAMRSYLFTLVLQDDQPLPEGTIVTLHGNFDDPTRLDERQYGPSSSDRLRYEISVDHLIVGATYHYWWSVKLPDGRMFTLPPGGNDHYTIIMPPLEQQPATAPQPSAQSQQSQAQQTPPAPITVTPAPVPLSPPTPAAPQPTPQPAPAPGLIDTPPTPAPVPETQNTVPILRHFLRWRYVALLAAIIAGYAVYKYNKQDTPVSPVAPLYPPAPEPFEPESEISVSGAVARVHDQLVFSLQPVAMQHDSNRLYAAIAHPTRLTEFRSDLQTQPLIRVTNERGECFVYLGGLVGAMPGQLESFDIKAQLQRGMHCK